MTAYAIGNLRPTPDVHEDVVVYIERVQDTLDPFGGRFLVHGAPRRAVPEGDWPEALVLIGFPSFAHARAWYDSPAYQELIPLRSRHMDGDILLVEGVPEGYHPAMTARALRTARAAG